MTSQTLSTLPQDVESFKPLTLREQREQRKVARAIVVEILAAKGFRPGLIERIHFTSSTRMTSSMGYARYSDGRIKLSASPLWRRASPAKRRNTVIHELAHLLTKWLAPSYARISAHGPAWKAMMVRLGEEPVRCHKVPTVPRGGRRAAAAASAAIAPAPRLLQPTFVVDEVVMFGRTNGEQTRARVTKVGRKRLSLVTLEKRGKRRSYPVGSKFTASPLLCQKIGG